ncbi:MAG TPA: pentapeptide repeat-containing protein [Solirubrobacterales bacterium]|nr:pentapeptide repeat-containing protein [Solirubrobacterales bacterium]
MKLAIAGEEVIDARGLEVTAYRLRQIRQLLAKDADGRDHFVHWNFEGSSFDSNADLSRCAFRLTKFHNCSFGDRVSFHEAVFTRALFRHATFGDDADFERTDFGARADFHTAKFGERARFSHSDFRSTQFFAARFGDEAGFAGCRFAVNARFHSARFGSRAIFTGVECRGLAEFSGVYFGEKLQMAKARFGDDAKFVGTVFDPRARLTGWRVEGDLNMRSAHFLGPVTLHDALVSGSAIFSHASFDGSIDLGGVDISKSAYFNDAAINAADRFGPLHVDDKLDLRGVIVRSTCAFVISGTSLDFSDSRFLAPSRITVGRGDVLMERIQNDSRLVLATPPPIGVKMPSPRLLSVRGADLASMVISGLDVRPLRFESAEGIDGLRIESGTAFEAAPRGPRAHREVIAEEHAMRGTRTAEDGWFPAACQSPRDLSLRRIEAIELARIYRGLRKAREDMRDAPGAADFYYGEMEMRRLEARRRLNSWHGAGPFALYAGTYLLLELYRLFGGYGVRPSRPLLLFTVLALVAAMWVDCGSLIHDVLPGKNLNHPTLIDSSFEQCLVFVLRSALLLPTSAEIAASTGAEWVQIGARIVGPLLIGLFAFGMRARVHR